MTVIYHNPRCTKSRLSLQLLQDNHIEPTVIEYLKTPPSVEELKDILIKLEAEPKDIIRKNEDEYKALNIASIDDTNQLIELMVTHPKLIERPIVVHDGKAVIGRPPENILKII